MKMRLSEAASIVGGKLFGDDHEFERLQIDSREVIDGELFCAVRGERVDGHNFVDDALAKGAAGALVERIPAEAHAPLIEVGSVINAMAALGLHYRQNLKGPVVGVTGSAGKTTVKEMVAAALSPLGAVLKSEGNLNTEFGVPMTWAKIQPAHRAAVIEMAMRGPGQIAHLARISEPHIGVITSIGSAHIGELGSEEAIATAKAELLQALPPTGTAVIPSDSKFSGLLRDAANCKVVSFGQDGDYRVADWRQNGDWVEFVVSCAERHLSGRVFGIGQVQAKNAAAAIAAAHAAGVSFEQAIESIEQATFPPKRMQVFDCGGVTIWLDAYNSSPESCKLALESFAQAEISGRRIAVLGDMLELGDFAEEKHREVGQTAAIANLDELALVGNLARFIAEGARDAGFEGEVSFFEDAIAARRVLDRACKGDGVLIKASRGLALEHIIEASI